MNLFDYNIKPDCEEQLRPIYIMKWIAEERQKTMAEDVTEEYLRDMTKGIIHTEFYTIIKFIICIKNIRKKDEFIEFIKNMTMETIYEIYNSGPIYKQGIANYLDLEGKEEIDRLMKHVIRHIEENFIDYDAYIKQTIDGLINVEDNIINTIENEKYEYYEELCSEEKKSDMIDKMIYLYDNGLLIWFDRLTTSKRIYKCKICLEEEYEIAKDYLSQGFNRCVKTIITTIVNDDRITADHVMAAINKTAITKNEKVQGFLWAETKLLNLGNSKRWLAELYENDPELRDYEKAINYYISASNRGWKSYRFVARIYEKMGDLEKAHKYLEKAKESGEIITMESNRVEEMLNEKKALEEMNNECIFVNDAIEEFKKRTAKASTKIVLEGECDGSDVLSSKIGGMPYIPENEDWPVDSNGDKMPLLLQVNFKEMNSNKFPNNGILQIFLDKSLDYPPEYVIRYHDTISYEYKTDMEPADVSEFVTEDSYKIRFEECTEYMPLGDYRFEDEIMQVVGEILDDKYKVSEIVKYAKLKYKDTVERYDDDEKIAEEVIIEEMSNKIYGNQITMGGYADFTQTDPRGYEKEKEKLSECLFKLDSCGGQEFYIGDSGILSVLISEEDLKNARFDRAVLDWDCC